MIVELCQKTLPVMLHNGNFFPLLHSGNCEVWWPCTYSLILFSTSPRPAENWISSSITMCFITSLLLQKMLICLWTFSTDQILILKRLIKHYVVNSSSGPFEMNSIIEQTLCIESTYFSFKYHSPAPPWLFQIESVKKVFS